MQLKFSGFLQWASPLSTIRPPVALLGPRGVVLWDIAEDFECLQVRLSPVTAHAVLGAAVADLDGAVVTLEDLWGREAARISEHLDDLSSWEDRFALTDAWLARGEQGFPAAEPGASDAGEFTTLLRAVAASGLQVGEFFSVFMKRVPAREHQDDLQRSLVVLLDDWADQATPEGRAAAAAALRTVARDALRMHPKLKARGAWAGHQGELPVIEGTLIKLTVEHLPHDRAFKPVWLWTSCPDADPDEP